MEETPENSLDTDTTKISDHSAKFKLAGYGFLVLNLIYLAVVVLFIPGFNFDMSVFLSFLAYVLLIGFITYYILQKKKLLTKILAFVYAGRSVNAIYLLFEDNIFPAVPYFLPCLLITFYLLGRAVWDWP